jgi:hypothetical protein
MDALRIAESLGTTVEHLVTGERPKTIYDHRLASRPVTRGIVEKLFAIPEGELAPVIILVDGLAERYNQTSRVG